MYIIGGRILTMAGRDIKEGIIHIENGKISEIGAREEVKVKDGEKVLIVKDSLIMPGIIEAIVTWELQKRKKEWRGMTVMKQSTPSRHIYGR